MSEAPPPLSVEVDELPTRSPSYRKVEVVGGRFLAKHPWHTPGRGFLIRFLLFWNTIVAVFLVNMWGTGPILFVVPHLVAGVAVLWYVAAGWWNQGVIRVEHGSVSSSFGPLPFPFRRQRCAAVELAHVERFRVERRRMGTVNDKAVYEYVVVADTTDARGVDVTYGLPTTKAAEFLQARFEHHRAAGRGFAVDVARGDAPAEIELSAECNDARTMEE